MQECSRKEQQTLTLPAKLSGHLSGDCPQVGMKQSVRPQAVFRQWTEDLGKEVGSQVRCGAAVAHHLEQWAVLAIFQCLGLCCRSKSGLQNVTAIHHPCIEIMLAISRNADLSAYL